MLIDKLLQESDDWLDCLADAVVFEVSNVEAYVQTGAPRYSCWELPNVAPQYPKMWFEYNVPAQRRGTLTDKHGNTTPIVRYGARLLFGSYPEAVLHSQGDIYVDLFHDLETLPYWGAWAELYAESATTIRSYPFHVMWGISKQGQMLLAPPHSWILSGDEGQRVSQGEADEIGRVCAGILYTPLLAMSFMHCRNVKLVDSPEKPKLDAARAKKGKKPLVRYKTLEIEPMKRVLEEQGHSESTGLRQALHICRGHFKDYNTNKGLFGKYHGMYWWESQVRGRVSEGVVVKDYSVVAS